MKEKKVKDKNAPKKPISAFFFYQKARRPTIKVEMPALDNKELVAVRKNLIIENVGRMEKFR